MIETERKEVVMHYVSWDEVSILLKDYVLEKYEIKIPEDAQVRVLNRTDVMVNPHRIRIKYVKPLPTKGR